jgi:hypothetical protein
MDMEKYRKQSSPKCMLICKIIFHNDEALNIEVDSYEDHHFFYIIKKELTVINSSRIFL